MSGCPHTLCPHEKKCDHMGKCILDTEPEIETDPYAAWNRYARRSGLLDANGEAPDRLKAQTAFSAFAYAWNLLVKEHFLRRGEIRQ